MSEKKTNTSWGKVADWYGDYLEGDDTYQSKVILPNLLRLLGNEKPARKTAVWAGKGKFWTRLRSGIFAKEVAALGAKSDLPRACRVVGADISPG